ncbi:tripartite tricarboxylate transporter permease [Enterocloster sp. OA13]|uniref:tripartite tricarboxylate transporter permease n=1 Tax=Enterocloster sp. OA13 TaxID=2914161 RepID=UPI000E70915E|nr:tripartite tricarboxylate transporter permease [Enterocloster sp. OA13]RJW34428.1 Tat pathway signal protein [Clostridiales bacterium TF09-2AC]
MEYLSLTLSTLLEPASFAIMLGSVVLGIVFGAVPGLTSNMAITLLLPVTFKMTAKLGITTLMSIYVGGMSGGFIAATLVGIPGTPSSIATCFDAYPLSQKGQTTKALGAGVLGSFLGTFLSTVIAVFFCPLIARAAVNLGPWEYFGLCTMAITLVVSLSKGNMFKGLAAAFIGLLLSSVGYAPFDATARFTFGVSSISGGINMVALMLGTFAVYQVMINYAMDQQNLPEVGKANIKGIGVTLKELKDNAVNIIRSFFIGLWIGFLPGMGAGISNMIAYSQAKSASRHPEEFGKGCVDGVFASEVSNNAAIGGAIIPLIALGIPGDTVTAIMLSGLMIHGIEPGPLLMTKEPELVYVIFGAVLLAAVITLVLQLFGMRLFPRLLTIPYHYLFGTIGIICFVGAFSDTNALFNCGLMLACAVFALFMQMAGLPMGPMMLAFILGGELETNLRRSMMMAKGNPFVFFTRPVSCVFLLIAIVSVLMPLVSVVAKGSKKDN